MVLRSLIEGLQHCKSVGDKTRALHAVLAENTSEIINGELHINIADLVGTVNFPADKYGEARLGDGGFSESCRYARLLCKVLVNLMLTINPEQENEKRKVFSSCLPYFLMLCTQLQRNINPWCDKETESIANNTLQEILRFGGFQSLRKAMDAQDLRIFHTTFELILPDLTSEKWKESPAARSTFIYIVTKASGDGLAENLHMILPFALILTDDFILQNSVAGIKCINHILNEVQPSEIRLDHMEKSDFQLLFHELKATDNFHSGRVSNCMKQKHQFDTGLRLLPDVSFYNELRGRADVLHDALSKKLYTREPEIAKVLITCILRSLDCLEPEMMRKRGCKIPKHDQCFDTVLNNFHLSSDAFVRRIYAEAIPRFISRMGIHSIGHMKTILIVLSYALETSELVIVSCCAKTVTALVNSSWPRMNRHSEKLLELLVKTLYSLENDEWRTRDASHEEKTQTIRAVVEAMAMLALVSKELVMETADMLQKEDLGLERHSLLLKQLIEDNKETFGK